MNKVPEYLVDAYNKHLHAEPKEVPRSNHVRVLIDTALSHDMDEEEMVAFVVEGLQDVIDHMLKSAFKRALEDTTRIVDLDNESN